MRRLGPIPVRTTVQPRSPQWLWDACCAGREPAEALDVRDREDLVAGLLAAGWWVREIAVLTRMSEYTTDRIVRRLTAATVLEVAA